MNITEFFVRPLSVVVCASLGAGCILTTTGDDDGGQDGTDGDASATADNDATLDGNDDPSAPDTGIDETGEATSADDTTTGPVGDCSANLVLDPGFEAGTPSEVWEEASATFTTPICDSNCTDDASAAPYEGEFWAWFGGLEEAETASLAQSITIPAAENAQLSFRFSINATTGTGDDEFVVTVDDEPVFMVTDAEMEDYTGYTLVEVDLTPYADGAVHSIRFESDHPGHPGTGLITNFFLDQVALVVCDAAGTESGDSTDEGTTAADETTGTDSGTSGPATGGTSDGTAGSTTTL